MKLKFTGLAYRMILLLIIASVLSLILTAIIGPLTGALAVFMPVIGLFLWIYTWKWSNLDNMNWSVVVALLLGVVIFGTLIAFFMPSVGGFLFTMSDVTVNGIVWSLFYVFLADVVIKKYLKM